MLSTPSTPVPGAEDRDTALPPPTLSLARSRRLLLASSVAAVLALPAYVVIRHPLSAAPSPAPAAKSAAPSVATLEEQLREAPSVNAKINLSLAYINNGASARAIPLLLEVVAEAPQNAIAWNNLCVAHTLQRSYDLAIQDCENALGLEPNFQLARNNLRWAHQEKAAALNPAKQ
jgi:Flp pilus assembly protein TadD